MTSKTPSAFITANRAAGTSTQFGPSERKCLWCEDSSHLCFTTLNTSTCLTAEQPSVAPGAGAASHHLAGRGDTKNKRGEWHTYSYLCWSQNGGVLFSLFKSVLRRD